MIRELYEWMKNIYVTPSSEVIALRELEESKRRLLEAQRAREYADSMCKFHEAKIKRLTVYLHKDTEEQSADETLIADETLMTFEENKFYRLSGVWWRVM